MTKTSIEWTQHVWNPFAGCSVLSPGCTNCYAMKMAARIEACNAGLPSSHGGALHYAGTTKIVNGNPVWTGKIGIASDEVLVKPLRRKKPTTWFVNSMSDLFHENVPDEAIDRVFAVMALTPQHTYQVLTKRSQRMREYFEVRELGRDGIERGRADLVFEVVEETYGRQWYDRKEAAKQPDNWPLPNVWLGVSTERQQEADERIPDLLATPAAVRFISAEPLLGPIDLTDIPWSKDRPTFPESDDVSESRSALHQVEGTKLDWVIVGGESGSSARPMHPDWARDLRDQCTAAGVPFFFKQWGGWEPATEERGHVDGSMERSGARWVHLDGLVNGPSWHRADGRTDTDPFAMMNVGKKRAGNLLDGVEHNAMPEAASR